MQASIGLSANSLAGVIGVSSIRLIGRMAGKDVSFLTNTGATHNFIDPITVRRLGLQT